jgi:hypothetical protein
MANPTPPDEVVTNLPAVPDAQVLACEDTADASTTASIFISYTRQDRDMADRLAARLLAAGYSVWWDRQIRGGRDFHQETEAAIKAAKLVIVLWSERSVVSDWVRAEASWALEDSKLLPARIDQARTPLRVTQIQTINLVGWQGDEDTDGLRDLLREVEQHLGAAPVQVPTTITITPVRAPVALPAPRSGHRLAIILAGLAAIASVGAVAYVVTRPTPTPIEETQKDQPATRQIGPIILFDKGSVVFSAAAQEAIKTQLDFLNEHPDVQAVIEGYAVAGEAPAGTLAALPELRARMVYNALVAGGVGGTRLAIVTPDPAAAGTDDSAQQPRVLVKRR